MAKKVYYVICGDCGGIGYFNHGGDIETCCSCRGTGKVKTIIEED